MDKARAKQILKTPQLITSALAVLGLSVLFAMIAMIYFNPAFGWFAKNSSSTVGGRDIGVTPRNLSFYYAEQSGNGWGADTEFYFNDRPDLLEQLHKPGDTYTFRLKITNTGDSSLQISELGLLAPTLGVDEVPVTVDAVNYYFGTQVYVTVLNVNGAEVVSPENVYLLTLTGGGEPVTTNVSLYTFDSPYTLAVDASMTFVIRFTFENKNESQDVYKNFGVEDGVCQRRFYLQ